jgi:hypothetical protein
MPCFCLVSYSGDAFAGAKAPNSQPSSQPSPQAANDNHPSAANDNNRPSVGLWGILGRLGLVGSLAHDAAASSLEQGQLLKLQDEYNKDPSKYVLVVRFYGGMAGRNGRSWGPASMVQNSNIRSRWGIPNVNSMDRIAFGAIPREVFQNPSLVQQRPALPLDGYPGGGLEFFIPNPSVVNVYADRHWGGNR